jgi:hypothetical protein
MAINRGFMPKAYGRPGLIAKNAERQSFQPTRPSPGSVPPTRQFIHELHPQPGLFLGKRIQ